jgi:tripartite-type tricarboxylate transporter receptor subunit TctC
MTFASSALLRREVERVSALLRSIGWVVPLAAMLSGAHAVSGQDYPTKPLRIVTSEAGGGNDVPARLVAQGLTLALGQQVVVENRPSGVMPGDIVSKAQPNGYTLLLYNNALWTGPLIQAAPYDAARDFAPITAVAKAVNVLVVSPALPVKSVADLIALAKSKPGGLNYGSSGTGASNHLAAEMFKTMAHVDIVRINYKGASPALTALLAGELQLMFPSAGAVTPHIRAGRVKALAVTGAEPTALFPGVPTVAATLPGYESIAIYGLFAPAATPRTIIVRLNAEIVKYLDRADVKEKFFNAGMDTAGGTPGALAAAVKSEVTRMGRVIKDAGIRGE